MAIKILKPTTDSTLTSDLTSSHGNEKGRINLRIASRQAMFDSVTSASSFTFDFDFGSATEIDYCFIGGLHNAISRASVDGNNDSIKLTFYADDNSSFTTPETATVNLQLSDLMGLTLKDYVYNLSFTVNYRYYRVRIETINADSIRLFLNKLWIGKAYDLGKSPNLPIPVKYSVTPTYHDKGFRFNYVGLTDADRLSLYQNLDKYKLHLPVVLYDDDDYFLNGETLSYCKVLDVNYETRVDGIYNATVDFITDY